MRFEARTLDDIRALGGNSEEDERRFATVARISEINLGLYRTFMQPWIRLLANEGAPTGCASCILYACNTSFFRPPIPS